MCPKMSRVEGLFQSGLQSGTLRAWEELHWKSLHHTQDRNTVSSLCCPSESQNNMHQEATPGCTGNQRLLMQQRFWCSAYKQDPGHYHMVLPRRQQNQQLSLWPGVNFKCGTKESGPQGTDQAGGVGTCR